MLTKVKKLSLSTVTSSLFFPGIVAFSDTSKEATVLATCTDFVAGKILTTDLRLRIEASMRQLLFLSFTLARVSEEKVNV